MAMVNLDADAINENPPHNTVNENLPHNTVGHCWLEETRLGVENSNKQKKSEILVGIDRLTVLTVYQRNVPYMF